MPISLRRQPAVELRGRCAGAPEQRQGLRSVAIGRRNRRDISPAKDGRQ